MSFEQYGNKLINLLSKIEKKLNPSDVQIGGGDGPISVSISGDDPYVKIISYSVNHVSVLVHLEKNGNVKELENPQISYDEITEYSIEQQLRLGCDNIGNMYNYSIVLTHRPKNTQGSGEASEALGGLARAVGNFSRWKLPKT